MKGEFCPKDCLFDPESDNSGVRETCGECLHSEDEVMDPFPVVIMKWAGHFVSALIVGRNKDSYYIKDGDSLSSVSKNSRLIKK